MKKNIYLIILLFFPFFSSAQLSEDFTDGDFTSSPAWNGDVTLWQVVSGQLNSNSTTASSTFYLSTPAATGNNLEWKIYMNLKFSTSSNNYVDVYLMSDSSNLNANGNGYFVRIGGTADEICLYRKDAGTTVKIIDGIDNRSQASSSDNKIHLKITRSVSDDWSLFDDNTGTALNFIAEGNVNDGTYLSGNYFGISVTQSTASFFNRHFFDDISIGPIPLDSTPPSISSLNAVSQNQADVLFSEPVDVLTAQDTLNYNVNNGIGNPSLAVIDGTNPALIHLTFTTNFQNGILQTITINNIKDLNNNIINLSSETFTYYESSPADTGDIIINEILFNPKQNGFDYVEIYNNSQKAIDLQSIYIARVDSISDILFDNTAIVSSKVLLLPGQYAVVTESANDIKSKYNVKNPDNLLEIKNLPSFSDKAGIVAITTPAGERLDQFHYIESYHFPLLKDVEGVSLERLSSQRSADDATNWHSAAQSAGFGTPTYKNSEYSETDNFGTSFNISPEVFSPDADGNNDVVNIVYHFDTPGNIANVIIYDSRGRLSRKLIRNELLGNNGTFSWDGINENREKAAIGIYIIYIELFDIDGKVKKYKKTCVLGGKL